MQMFTACIFILINLQSSGAAVDCPTACNKCRENREYFALLDVYCAMCKECRERRQEWMNRVPSGRRLNSDENRSGDQEECQTPQSCEPEDDSLRITLRSSLGTTTTISTTTPSTTTKRPCPRPTECKKGRQKPMQGCCIPICPYQSNCPSENAIQKLTKSDSVSSTTSTNTNNFFYVHVGVPQELFNRL